jgi:hypothetical protein
MPSDYDIAEADDGLTVRGVGRSELTDALDLIRELRTEGVLQMLDSFRTLQAEHAEANRAELLHALMGHQVSLMPPATVTQMERLATQRNALLATPIYTHETLGKMRGLTESSTRTWLTRQRSAHKLFTISYNGRTLIPAFQLDERGEPRRELQSVLSVLDEGGVQGWPLWTWLTEPTSFLSGGVPEHVAESDPKRALRAARRFAAAPAA